MLASAPAQKIGKDFNEKQTSHEVLLYEKIPFHNFTIISSMQTIQLFGMCNSSEKNTIDEINKNMAKNGKNSKLPKNDMIDVGSPQCTKIGVAIDETNNCACKNKINFE